jgi:asparagine synthase (glutamine-hydrolysing)
MEEPFDNPSCYIHHKMLQLIKAEGVSVVVTGAGGDEILSGYESMFWPKAYVELKNSGFLWIAHSYEFIRHLRRIQHGWQILKDYSFRFPKYLYNRLLNSKKLSKYRIPTRASNYMQQYSGLSFHEQVLYHFKVAKVPYYMLSSDHFAMGIPLEHRFPLLDYRLIEFCLQMPINYLFKNGWTKYLLRKAMEPYLPKRIVWRKAKMGFAFPYHTYFSRKRLAFKPLLKQLDAINFPTSDFGTYDHLLQTNPALLWRLLSTAIWIKNCVPSIILKKKLSLESLR